MALDTFIGDEFEELEITPANIGLLPLHHHRLKINNPHCATACRFKSVQMMAQVGVGRNGRRDSSLNHLVLQIDHAVLEYSRVTERIRPSRSFSRL